MTRTLVVSLLFLAGCRAGTAPERYGFVARLGADTVSLERVTRNGDSLVSDEVDRFPRVRQRHTEIKLARDGSVERLVMDIHTPSESPEHRERRVVVDVTKDSVHITKRDRAGTITRAFATHGVLTMPHLPQMYSLTDLYFAAALRRADSLARHSGDTIGLHQYYIDREFDDFPLHDGVVQLGKNLTAELSHDWLAGSADARFDSTHHMMSYSGARSTYKVEVVRVADQPDVASIGAQFAAAETKGGGMKQLSVRDTVRAHIGSASFTIDYGRPLARGRTLLGNIIPYDEVWRTGANAATQFSTSSPITLGSLTVPKGTHTLWTVPRRAGADLIVNRQTGQWGTGYDDAHDLGMTHLATATITPVEQFTMAIIPVDAHHGALVLEWGTFRWTAPVIVP